MTPCLQNPQAPGTDRTIEVDAQPARTRTIPSSLPLNAKELVLSFDNGSRRGTTPKSIGRAQSRSVRDHLLPGMLLRTPRACSASSQRWRAAGNILIPMPARSDEIGEGRRGDQPRHRSSQTGNLGTPTLSPHAVVQVSRALRAIELKWSDFHRLKKKGEQPKMHSHCAIMY